jgi:amino acid permease
MKLINISEFITHLRSEPEEVKKRWVWGASIVTIIFVILLWFVYLSFTLPVIDNTATANEATTPTESAETPSVGNSIFRTFGRGISILYRDSADTLSTFTEMILESVKNITDELTKPNIIKIDRTPPTANTTSVIETTSTATSSNSQ